MKARRLNPAEVREILEIKSSDVDARLMRKLFAATDEHEARFNTFDTFQLGIGQLYNKEPIETTVGRYIFNLFCIPEKFLKKHGYQNIVLDSKGLGGFENQLGQMLFEDQITTREYADYLDKTEWLAMNIAYYLVPSLNYDIVNPIDSVRSKRDELFEKYKSKLDAGDVNAANLVEKELLALARSELEASGNEAYDLYKSGEFSFDNNYKKSSVFSGIVQNPYTGKVDVLRSNYADGILPEDVDKLNNLTVIGGWSRGKSTEQGGYFSKKINNATQAIVIDEPDTDCGTQHYMQVTIEPHLKQIFVLRYILEDGKLVLLTTENIGKYVGKTVLMRSPLFCHGDKICNKCAGETFYRLGVRNAGLFTQSFGGSLLNLMIKFIVTSYSNVC